MRASCGLHRSSHAPDSPVARRGWRACPGRWVLFIASFAAVAPALAAEAFPPLQVVDHIESYRVTARSIRLINAQLASNSDAVADTANGSTRSEIGLTSHLEPDGVVCRIARLEVRLDVTTRLPEWRPEGKPSGRTRARWEKAAAILARHEAGHREHAVDAAEALRQSLSALAPMKDCQRLDTAIGIELRSAIRRLDSRELRYDARTRGGLRDDPLRTAGADGGPSGDAVAERCRTRPIPVTFDNAQSGSIGPPPMARKARGEVSCE